MKSSKWDDLSVAKKWNDLEAYDAHNVLMDPICRIHTSGTMYFNKAAIYSIQKYYKRNEWMLMLYSKSNNAIVFKFNESKKDNYVKLFDANGKAPHARTRNFLKSFDIDFIKHAGKYVMKTEEIPKLGDCCVIYLDECIAKYKERTSKKEANHADS
jgi:hypothetical protein